MFESRSVWAAAGGKLSPLRRGTANEPNLLDLALLLVARVTTSSSVAKDAPPQSAVEGTAAGEDPLPPRLRRTAAGDKLPPLRGTAFDVVAGAIDSVGSPLGYAAFARKVREGGGCGGRGCAATGLQSVSDDSVGGSTSLTSVKLISGSVSCGSVGGSASLTSAKLTADGKV